MAFVPFPSGIKTELVWSFEGSVMENVLHFSLDFDPDEDSMLALNQLIISRWSNNTAQYFCNDLVLTKVVTTDLHADNAPAIETFAGAGIPGGDTGDPLPANCALLMEQITGLRGRSYRGRTYLFGFPETRVSGSTWESAWRNQLRTEFLNWLSWDVPTGPAILSVASRVHDGVERTTGVLTPVIDLGMRPYVVSQRRRLPGRGN